MKTLCLQRVGPWFHVLFPWWMMFVDRVEERVFPGKVPQNARGTAAQSVRPTLSSYLAWRAIGLGLGFLPAGFGGQEKCCPLFFDFL